MIFIANVEHRSIKNLFYFFSCFYIIFFTLDSSTIRFFLATPWIVFLVLISLGWKNIKAKREVLLFNVILLLIFFSSLFYDKSTSSFFHPIVKKEFVLKKDIYFSSNSPHASISFEQPQGKNYFVLNKGEKIKIGALFRELSIVPSNYHIAIDTPFSKALSGATNVIKIKNKFYITTPSNSFFYALGILNDDLTKLYTKIPNFIFIVGYTFYPIIILILSILFYFSMRELKVQIYFYKFLQFIVYFIAYFYLYFTATNDGFSGFLLGVPFAIFLFYTIKKNTKYKNLHLAFALFCVFLYFADKSQWSIKYPTVNKQYTILYDTNYALGKKLNTLEVSYIQNRPTFTLFKGDTIFINRQFVSDSRELGVTYTFEISSARFNSLAQYINKNRQDLQNQLCEEYRKYNKSAKCDKFYIFEEDKFYIEDNELKRLFATQGFYFDYTRTYQFVADILLFLPFYLLMVVVFIILFLAKKALHQKIKKALHVN